MAIKGKIGRAANEQVREQARELAATYRNVCSSPEGKYCFNPHDDAQEQTWVNTSQALDQVLSSLELFAETGSFGMQFDLRKFAVRDEYNAARTSGTNRNDAINLLTEKHGMSKSVIERTVRAKVEPSASEKKRQEQAKEIAIAAAKAATAALREK